MVADDVIKSSMVLIAWKYKQEGMNAMMGIMHALKNAVKDGDWIPALSTEDMHIPLNLDIRDPQFVDLLKVVDLIFEGKKADLTDGATGFINGLTVGFSQSKSQIVCKIGNLYFYK